MAVGNQATAAQINNTLTNYAVQLRGLMHQISDLNKQAGKLGTAGMQAIGLSPADAPLAIADAATLNTIAAIYYGQATQATLFNFDDALTHLWAGQ